MAGERLRVRKSLQQRRMDGPYLILFARHFHALSASRISMFDDYGEARHSGQYSIYLYTSENLVQTLHVTAFILSV